MNIHKASHSPPPSMLIMILGSPERGSMTHVLYRSIPQPRCAMAHELSLLGTLTNRIHGHECFPPPPGKSSPVLLKVNRMVLIRFIETKVRSVWCVVYRQVRAHSPPWWLTQIGMIIFKRMYSRSLMVEARGQAVEDGGLGAPKTQVSSEFIPHFVCVTDAK